MNKKTRLLALGLIFSLGMILVACGGESPAQDNDESASSSDGEAETFEFEIGHTTTEANQQHLAGVRLAELLEEKTDGAITMDVFELAQLGGEVEMIQALQQGVSAMTVTSHAAVTNFVPEWSIFDLP